MMLRRIWLPLLAAGLLGCAQTEHAATDVKAAVQAQASPLSIADAAFLDEAGRAGITAVTFGQLARAQASRAAVRDFGRRIVDEQTTTNQALTRLATAKQITPTATVDVTHQATYDRIAGLHGRAFDRAYLDAQVADLTASLARFQTQAAQGADPEVKALAAKTVPLLKTHLALATRLGGRASGDRSIGS